MPRTEPSELKLRLGLLREDLADEHPDLADARQQIAIADTQSDRLAKLAGDLLDLSQLDAQVPLRHEPVALGSLCQATIAEFEILPGAPIDIDDRNAGTALGDPGKIAQIIRILLDNARRYTPTDQPVRVIVTDTTIAVEDDGPGVAAHEHTSIFERFRRGTARDSQAGLGLGLAIGHELAQRMGGSLQLTSDTHPTRFELHLPPCPPTPQQPQQP